jgi:type II secretory pathway component PulF
MQTPSQTRRLVSLAVALLLSSAAAAIVFVTVPHFAETFASFGADLPMATLLVVRFYPVVAVVPALVFVVWLLEQRGLAAESSSMWMGAVSFLGIPVVLMLLMYWPIWKMSQPV